MKCVILPRIPALSRSGPKRIARGFSGTAHQGAGSGSWKETPEARQGEPENVSLGKWTLAASGLVFLWLTSCATFSPRPLSAPQAARDFSARTFSDRGLRAFLSEQKAARGTWDVNRLALAAAYFHPDVALARAESEEAAAGIQTAKMRPNPVITFSPQFASFRAPVFTPWFLGGGISLPFETASKRARRVEQACATAEAARWRVSSRAWQARSRVRSAMLDLHGANENIRLLEAELELHQDAIKKLTAQIEAGDVAAFELTQARLALNRSRLALEDQKRIRSTAGARLAESVGVPLRTLNSIEIDFSTFEKVRSPGAHPGMALTHRADLMALLAEYAAAEAALKLELARQYPDINLGPGYDYNSGQNRWQLGFSVALPFNRNRGPIAEAEARRVSAEKRFLARQAGVLGEWDAALAAYETSRSKAATASQLALEAEAAAQTTRRMVEAGGASALEFTRRQIESSASKTALLAANLEAQAAAGALEDAMQTPLR